MKSYVVRRSILDGFTFAFLVSALLAFTFHPTDEQIMDMKTNALLFFAIYAVGIVISAVLNNAGIKTFGESLFQPAHKKAQESKSWYKTFSGWHLVVLLVALLIVSLIKTKFSLDELLNEDGFNGAMRLFTGIFSFF